MIMNVQEMYIRFLYIQESIPKKNVLTVQNLYKVQTKNGLKLEIYVHKNNAQTILNLYN